MRVLVNEIERDVLFDLYQHFVGEKEILFIEYADASFSTPYCLKPFYIEEKIVNLQNVLKLCDDVDFNRTPIRKMIDWNDFTSFWALMFSIYKQRETGKKVSDVEFIYLKLKDKCDLVLTTTFKLNAGFTIDVPVLCGESALGKMNLYKDTDYGFEFVFLVEYVGKGFLGHSKQKFTHWHPQNLIFALDDVDKFMSNDFERFKFLK